MIAGTAEGLQWVYRHAWPYIEPLWLSGLYCPERFWWDSLAYPIQSKKAPAEIHSMLKVVLAQMRRDESVEVKLASHSEHDRERIAEAYAKVVSEIRMHYPDLANPASGA
ncbi:MAG TPA: hypothetical protein VJ813_03520 [Vicinamibacterales bacterium]|nr:hypothetical protein [Vicinamibacterales bacterium]